MQYKLSIVQQSTLYLSQCQSTINLAPLSQLASFTAASVGTDGGFCWRTDDQIKENSFQTDKIDF
jgi:hypothetical protein